MTLLMSTQCLRSAQSSLASARGEEPGQDAARPHQLLPKRLQLVSWQQLRLPSLHLHPEMMMAPRPHHLQIPWLTARLETTGTNLWPCLMIPPFHPPCQEWQQKVQTLGTMQLHLAVIGKGVDSKGKAHRHRRRPRLPCLLQRDN